MQTILQPIETVVVFDRQGLLSPQRFRIITQNGSETIKILQVQRRDRKKSGPDEIHYFRCLGLVLGRERLMDLQYVVKTGEWMLYRM